MIDVTPLTESSLLRWLERHGAVVVFDPVAGTHPVDSWAAESLGIPVEVADMGDGMRVYQDGDETCGVPAPAWLNEVVTKLDWEFFKIHEVVGLSPDEPVPVPDFKPVTGHEALSILKWGLQ